MGWERKTREDERRRERMEGTKKGERGGYKSMVILLSFFLLLSNGWGTNEEER